MGVEIPLPTGETPSVNSGEPEVHDVGKEGGGEEKEWSSDGSGKIGGEPIILKGIGPEIGLWQHEQVDFGLCKCFSGEVVWLTLVEIVWRSLGETRTGLSWLPTIVDTEAG